MFAEITYSVPNENENLTYTFPFPLASFSEVIVSFDGTAISTSDYTVNGGIVTFTDAPQGVQLIIKRVTDATNLAVDFTSGAFLNEEDLDNSAQQFLFLNQETQDRLSKLEL
jgi:hypothetical protein